jgi:hypothetical protein
MARAHKEYNPLDYTNLTRNCVAELMRSGPFDLPPEEEFPGAGVYALFYKGEARVYAKVQSDDMTWPIYVGKAVPPGGRKGGRKGDVTRVHPLHARLKEHARSIKAATNLSISDFGCRYLVVTPLWITMAERFLIEHFQPVWNVCIEGFGNHDPGSGRHGGEISWWDALHPGRSWAANLLQTRTKREAETRLNEFLQTCEKRTVEEILSLDVSGEDLVHDTDLGDSED